MNTNKCSPGQCLAVGEKVADILFDDPDVDKSLLQEAIDSRQHPFWGDFFTAYKKSFVVPEDSQKIVPLVVPVAPNRIVDDEGNIHFTLTSNGRTKEQWETCFENEKVDAAGKKYRLSDYAKNVLRRATEAPTTGVNYHIVVRPGSKISSNDRITNKIRAAADKKGWVKPHWEVSCLIRDTFTDDQLEQMGLWYIVTMHEPIESDGVLGLLTPGRNGGGRWLHANVGRPGSYWSDGGSFAFAVPQVGHQN